MVAKVEDTEALLEQVETLEIKLGGYRRTAVRADRIVRDLAHRATIGETTAQTVETELGAFLREVAAAA